MTEETRRDPRPATGPAAPPRAPRLSFALTGHRLDRLGADRAAPVRAALDALLGEIEQAMPGYQAGDLRLVSALADGADTIGAEVAAARGWPLDVALPFMREDYAADFTDEPRRTAFEQALGHARAVFELGYRAKGDASDAPAYERVGRVLRAQCDVLIAVWDGGPSRGRGGAQQVVAEAVLEGIPVIRLDPAGTAPPAILWDGMAEVDLGQQTLDTVGRHDVAELGAVLAQFDGLAGGDTPDDAPPRRRWTIMLAYPLLLALVGIRGLRRSDVWRSGPAETLAVPDSADPGFAQRFAAYLAAPFARANAAAVAHAQAFRSGYVANFALAAIAVVLSLLGLALPAAVKPLLLALELAAIAAILLQTRTGNRAGWHGKWLDRRALAERLRCLAITARLGDLELRLDAGRAPPEVTRAVNRAARAVGLPDARVDGAYLAGVRGALVALLDDQVAYLTREAGQMHRLEHRLHVSGTVLFAATALICAAFLAAKLVAGHAAAAFTPAATIAGAALPAIGAAIYGIRMQGDFAGTAARDAALARELATIRAVVAADTLSFDMLSRRARRVSGLLTADLGSWLQTYRARPLTLPG